MNKEIREKVHRELKAKVVVVAGRLELVTTGYTTPVSLADLLIGLSDRIVKITVETL